MNFSLLSSSSSSSLIKAIIIFLLPVIMYIHIPWSYLASLSITVTTRTIGVTFFSSRTFPNVLGTSSEVHGSGLKETNTANIGIVSDVNTAIKMKLDLHSSTTWKDGLKCSLDKYFSKRNLKKERYSHVLILYTAKVMAKRLSQSSDTKYQD